MNELESITDWMIFLSQDKYVHLVDQDMEINLFGEPGNEYLQIAKSVSKDVWSEYVFFCNEEKNQLFQLLQSLNIINFSLKELISYINNEETEDTTKGPGIMLGETVISVRNFGASND